VGLDRNATDDGENFIDEPDALVLYPMLSNSGTMIKMRMPALFAVLIAAHVSSATYAQSALDKMEVVFVGGYSKEQIQRKMDKVMRKYGEPINETNYNIVGSVLVALRKENGVPEMKILACVDYADIGDQMKIGEVAAICVTMLAD